jgi:hypothetical protein
MNDLPRSRRPSVQDHGRLSEQSRAADPPLQKQDVEPAPSHSHGDNSPLTSPTRDTASSDPGSTYQFRGLAARKTPSARLWLKCLARWLVTVVFIVAVYAVLIGYENYDVLSKVQKRQFSALITGFLIALGLITLSHLTSVAFDLRWWILCRKARSWRKVTYLLRCHSMSQLVMLALRSRRLSIHIFVAAWILLLLVSCPKKNVDCMTDGVSGLANRLCLVDINVLGRKGRRESIAAGWQRVYSRYEWH